ncbi:MAG: hypothetical protein H6772_02575 [Pseudomonadales bacterium]|nr:hypothetical protein [Pseudomonadales bacterium]
MKKYQVKKHFDWGSLKLEPLRYLSVSESEYSDSYTVVQDKTNESITVSKQAFINYEKMGNISEA